MTTYGWRDRNWTKDEVLSWFGDRGISLRPKELKKWHWENGKLWFVVAGTDTYDISDTDDGYADLTYTHRDDQSSIGMFELYDSRPIGKTPLAAKAVADAGK
jgi:hypothetical protein